MISRLLCLLLLVPLLTTSNLARSDNQREMVITGLEAPPYVIIDNKQKPAGILVDLIKQAFKPLGITPVFKISNWARAYEETKHGRADAIIPTIKSANREPLFSFPAEPLTVLHMALLKHPANDIRYDGDLTNLQSYRIGKVRKALVAPEFDQATTNGILNIEERTTFGLLALGVARQRLDLMAGDELMGLWGAAENGVLEDIETIMPYLAEVPVFLAISKASPYAAETEQISKALASAKKHQDFKKSLSGYERFLRRDLFENLIRHTQH